MSADRVVDYKKLKKGEERPRPLDLILFKGGDLVSDAIRFLEGRCLRHTSRIKLEEGVRSFSHVGLVVTREILDDERLERDKLYVWESTMSGPLSDGVKNVNDESFLGVQIRDLDEVVKAYLSDEDAKIAFAPLIDPVDCEALRHRFTRFVRKHDGTRYDANFASLFGSIYPALRPLRNLTEKIFRTKKWLFCSELAALTYKKMGIFPPDCDPRDCVPMDFLGFDEDRLPIVVKEPIYIKTSLK